MRSTPTIVYDCPCCGQGGLEAVRIKSSPPVEAVVCVECDRVWLAPYKVGLQNDGQLEPALLGVGVDPSWSSLDRISQGGAWDRLDSDYQAVLQRKNLS